MRLHNVVIVFDVYCLSESPETARAAVIDAFTNPDKDGNVLPPSEQVAIQVVHTRSVREAWRNQNPIVAGDVADADYERIKGKTTLEAFDLVHTPPVEEKKK